MGALEQVEVARHVLNLVAGLVLVVAVGVPLAFFMFRWSVWVGLIASFALVSFAVRLLLPVASALLTEQASRRK